MGGRNKGMGNTQPDRCEGCGTRYERDEDNLEGWYRWQKQHWSAPPSEALKTWEPLEDEHDEAETPSLLTAKRMDRVLERARLERAVGSDGAPNELFEALPEARQELFDLVRTLWKLVYCPADFVTVLFAMLYKGRKKGPAWKRSAYRSVGLLNHACKLL